MRLRNIFVSSDHHFGHRNIIKFCSETRPFDSIEEHDEQLIQRHNEVVNKNDDVYFLGDFAFCKEGTIIEHLRRLNGRKHFIFGNHDKQMRKPTAIKAYFEWMKEYHELKVDIEGLRTPAVMFHYPIHSWNRMHHGALHFYGHTHCNIPELFSGRARDIGVDSNNCYPWNVEDLAVLMNKCSVVDARERS